MQTAPAKAHLGPSHPDAVAANRAKPSFPTRTGAPLVGFPLQPHYAVRLWSAGAAFFSSSLLFRSEYRSFPDLGPFRVSGS